jgi:hypothetical protein
MKCANCIKDAMYVYRLTEATSVYYCGNDLPSFLEERRKAGLLNITEAFTEAKESAAEVLAVPKKKTVKKTADEVNP